MMADRVNKQYNAKGRTANSSQPSRPFQCKWPEGCSKVSRFLHSTTLAIWHSHQHDHYQALKKILVCYGDTD